MNKQIKRYNLAEIDRETLTKKLEKLGFEDGFWLDDYKGRTVKSKCYPLYKDVELHIVFDLDTLEWDDYEDTLVLDDEFCQPYGPFYQGKKGFVSDFLRSVIIAYNKVMDSLVREGVLVCKWAYDVHNKLVRDNIVNILEAEGYECQYHIVSQKKQKKVLIDKLREEVCEFTEEPSIEELADVLEVIDAIKEKFGYDDVELSLAKEQKKERNGAFDKMLFLEKAVINNG